MTYSYSEFLALRDGGLLTVHGTVVWTKRAASWDSRLSVSHPAMADGELHLRMKVNPKRPYSPHVLLVARDVCMLRLDVNDKHREGAEMFDCTHIQETPYPDSRPTVLPPPPPPRPVARADGEIRPGLYRSVFHYFTERYKIDAGGVTWCDPWKEAPL